MDPDSLRSAGRLNLIDKHLSPSSNSSICFSTAADLLSNKQISWEEYLHHCLMHYVRGFPTHEEDKGTLEWPKNKELLAKDPFAYSLWRWQSRADGGRRVVNDVFELENIFHAYKHGTVTDIQAKLSILAPDMAETMRRALALPALQDRKLDVLKYVINDGQQHYDPMPAKPPGGAFEIEALGVSRGLEPELYDIIHQSSWMKHVKRDNEEFWQKHPFPKSGRVGAREEDIKAILALNLW